ncbi:MAG TPA: CDF family Co(II)/Ni(II) efflux transporter DmeF [Usitatibacter sp.]|nr:CDF family Co(II)/Ni(II) efflux transporter DmeF [Usitatibacter sp.]
MAIHDLSHWRHDHAFDAGNRAGERRTWIVVAITAITMGAEIVGGVLTGSMALLADGWHMATHVVALSIAGFAYLLARRWSRDDRFAFGTWKIEVLGAFTSALLLGVVALAMAWESAWRLVHPEEIRFLPALVVAAIGLAVNLVSAAVLHGHGHSHGDAHDPGHERHAHGHDEHAHGHDEHAHGHDEHAHHRHDEPRARARGNADLNLRSAYLHVVTDAFTSVLAIVALTAGWLGGWKWLDPAMGIVGAVVIAWWAKGLIADSARVLLDREMDVPLVADIRRAVQSDGDAEIADLHVWRVGRSSYAAVLTVVAHRPLEPEVYRRRLAALPALAHVSVEVNRCPHGDCP